MKIRIGIDEVGRGCLAGPVTVCAVLMTENFRKPKCLPELRDSKKMTALQRETWYRWMIKEGREEGIFFSISSVSPKVVDRINIARAANLAAWRSLQKTMALIGAKKGSSVEITLDGGLYVKSRSFQKRISNGKSAIKTVIRADRKFKEVKMASVAAKVSRDAKMVKIAKVYPEYGFDLHKGYGTKVHIKAIKEKGEIDGFHRKSFLSGLRT
ncbi:MAG: ribonuclease HII [Candidatus Colwellbacteria bacterium]|nr:ribonuclease HII [Candidatus Colwellbacteria bacterium]